MNGKSLQTIHDTAPQQAGSDRVLLVMLPGAMDAPEDFLRYGFVQALRERHLPVDAILADAHMDYYLERSISQRLAQDLILPARASQYRQTWLLGISLGGMGALLAALNHPTAIDGVILLAPYLGNRGKIAEIARYGGLDEWQPEKHQPLDDEQALLMWLKAYRSDAPALPVIYLGYGKDDRYAPASTMLSQRLPDHRVTALPGGHDWKTWQRLWKHILDKGLFASTT